MAQVFLRALLLLFFCSACSGSGCSDPPPGSPFESAGVETDLDQCVGVTQGDEKTKGVVHQCKGKGTPKLFYTIECDGSFCPDTKRKQKNLDSFKFGGEDYENASIAAQAGPAPPIIGVGSRLGSAVRVRIAPDSWARIRRAAAVAVMKFVPV